MKIFLIVAVVMGGIASGHAQGQSYSDDQAKLLGRWIPTSRGLIGLPDEQIVIGAEKISMKDDDGCNTLVLTYTIEGGEIKANRAGSTLLGCRSATPRESFAKAFRHSKYEIDGDVLRLTTLSADGQTYEFHRVR